MSFSSSVRRGSIWPISLMCLAAAANASAHTASRSLPTLHVPAPVARHQVAPNGRPDPSQQMQLSVALPMRDRAGLEALLAQMYDPHSPSFHHYLSVEAFTARFGPAAGDYRQAAAFFADHGLRITGTSKNRYILDVAGSIADVERVFHVTMRLFRHPTEKRDFIAPDREPSLDLPVPVLHVSGLSDFDQPRPRLLQAQSAAARTGTGSGPDGYFIASDIRAAYYGTDTALTGQGQSVGLMELGPYDPTDVSNYFKLFKQTLTAKIVPVSTDGTTPTCSDCNDGEQALDIEYAIGMAPGLDRVQVYVGHTPESVLNRMASDDSSKQLSTSWGWNEERDTDEPIFKEMAAQGQTNLTASGDYSSLNASGPWPEEDAFIVAVGGTDLTTHGPGGAWQHETGWEDSAGGPSTDKSIKIAKYQLPFINAANKGSTKLRNVPDIAGDADFDNYICAHLKCSGGWGGTSFASPIWAGFIALANQQAAAHGDPAVGFLNPTVYALSGSKSTYKSIFHDEKQGKSGVFNAVKFYDLVTGLGSPAGQKLIDALAP